MGATICFVFAGLAAITAILFGLATLNNPYNDLTRAYTGLFALLSGISPLGLWLLGAVLVGRTD